MDNHLSGVHINYIDSKMKYLNFSLSIRRFFGWLQGLDSCLLDLVFVPEVCKVSHVQPFAVLHKGLISHLISVLCTDQHWDMTLCI